MKPLVISVFAVLPTSHPKQLVIIVFAGKGEAKTAWLSVCSAFRRNIQKCWPDAKNAPRDPLWAAIDSYVSGEGGNILSMFFVDRTRTTNSF